MESYLQKKSPSLLKGYQKRYFKVQDQETKLVYYKKQPGLHDVPKGMLDLEKVEQVQLKDKKKCVLVFQYLERQFELKADCIQLAEQWIKYLSTRSTTLRQNQSRSTLHHDSKQSWRRHTEQEIGKIQLENEQSILGNNLELIINQENQEALSSLGIAQYFSQIDQQIIDKTVLMGYLVKNGQNNKLSFKKRWFLMVSSFSLVSDHDLRVLVQQDQLPGWLKVNKLYYFDSPEENSQFKGKVPANQITSITKHDLSYSSQDHLRLRYFLNDIKKMIQQSDGDDYYSFTIETTNKNITLFTDYLQVLTKWVDGLRCCVDKVRQQEQQIKEEQENNYEEQRKRMYEETLQQIEEAKIKEKEINKEQSLQSQSSLKSLHNQSSLKSLNKQPSLVPSLPKQPSLVPSLPKQPSLVPSLPKQPSLVPSLPSAQPSLQQESMVEQSYTIKSSEYSEDEQRVVVKEGFVQYKAHSRFMLGQPYEQKYLRVYRDGLELTQDFQNEDGLIKLPIDVLSGLHNYKKDRFKIERVLTQELLCTIKCDDQQTRDQYCLLVNQLIHQYKLEHKQIKNDRSSLMNLNPQRFNPQRRMLTVQDRRNSMDSKKSSMHSHYKQNDSLRQGCTPDAMMPVNNSNAPPQNMHDLYNDTLPTPKKKGGLFSCCM